MHNCAFVVSSFWHGTRGSVSERPMRALKSPHTMMLWPRSHQNRMSVSKASKSVLYCSAEYVCETGGMYTLARVTFRSLRRCGFSMIHVTLLFCWLSQLSRATLCAIVSVKMIPVPPPILVLVGYPLVPMARSPSFVTRFRVLLSAKSHQVSCTAHISNSFVTRKLHTS